MMTKIKELCDRTNNDVIRLEPVTYESMADKLTDAGLSVELLTHSLDNHVNYFIKPV